MGEPTKQELLAEATRLADERQRIAAAKVRAKLGPGPRERETGIDPFAEGAPLAPLPSAPSHPDVTHD